MERTRLTVRPRPTHPRSECWLSVRRHNHGMADNELAPERLASVFANFIQEIAAAAKTEPSPVLDKITAHLGADPAQLPVTLEQFDTFDQPNLQVAMEAYLKQDGRTAELVGVS